MEKVINFLTALRDNNNKKWFDANKAAYLEANACLTDFAGRLITAMSTFDPTVAGLTVKDCTYRIYRDVRFSKNKDPYKTHMGVYICRGGKKSGYAGYYFHIEPEGGNDMGGNFLTSGLYMPESVVLKSVREEIIDNGDGILAAIRKAKGFTLGDLNKLKKLPAGYPADSPHPELLKLKDLYIEQKVSNDFLCQDNLPEKVAAEFRKTHDLITILNNAVTYAYEEMM